MKNFYLKQYLKKIQRTKLRLMLRGFSKLKKNGQLGRIMDAQIELVETPLLIPPNHLPKIIFGAAFEKANEVVRDFLISRVALYPLNKKLLVSLGKENGQVVHPLPKKWRHILKSLGWKVSDVKCEILWRGFTLLCLGYGLFLFIKNLSQSLNSVFKAKYAKKGKYVYFAGLTKNELPQGKEGNSYDIISWYLSWANRSSEIKSIGHNVKGVPSFTCQGVNVCFVNPLVLPQSLAQTLRFILWGVGMACFCLFEWFRGRWWSPLMFGPSIQSYIAKNQSTYAVDYLFHNSGPRKPLWLYEVEARGATTTFYFYSTNCDSFMTNKGYQATPAYYRNMQWGRYLVWDQEQRDFLVRSGNSKENIKVVGPIWFSDCAAQVPEISKNSILLFDVLPMRSSVHAWVGARLPYYLPAITKKFFEDVLDVCLKLGLVLVHKRKREINKNSKMYINLKTEEYLKTLCLKVPSKQILPKISGFRIIQKAKVVVSMPFTSTAIIADYFNKPSCYYDPTNLIQKCDRANHGITVISGKEELLNWVKKHV